MAETFEEMLTGGRPNSLGRTGEVVERVLEQPARFEELFRCYESEDEIVRLRTSNAMKRIEAVRPDLLAPYLDRFIEDVGRIDQASAQWTLAQLFDRLSPDMSEKQKKSATALMQRNLASHDDWIVLNTTIDTLSKWAKTDAALRKWLRPRLQRLSMDARKSVASRASKRLKALGSP
ncbi:MAG: hypothetical protein GC206_11680 [Alphaproteobacteria bacterium]|nr:hypothetical protein [Alphaproteobacteria bacterium]